MSTLLKKLIRSESGATMIEYGLIAALIAVFLIAALQLVGGGLDVLFTNIANQVNPPAP